MELTRRELVAAFLGSAVAASACRKTAPREPTPGALVDRVVDTGPYRLVRHPIYVGHTITMTSFARAHRRSRPRPSRWTCWWWAAGWRA